MPHWFYNPKVPIPVLEKSWIRPRLFVVPSTFKIWGDLFLFHLPWWMIHGGRYLIKKNYRNPSSLPFFFNLYSWSFWRMLMLLSYLYQVLFCLPPAGRDDLYLGKSSRGCLACRVWWWISWHGASYQQQTIANWRRPFLKQHEKGLAVFGFKIAGIKLNFMSISWSLILGCCLRNWREMNGVV